jgi:hypothetical protein
MPVLLSRISRIDGHWVAHGMPVRFDDAECDSAEAQAGRWGKAWRAEDPENRRYVLEELAD